MLEAGAAGGKLLKSKNHNTYIAPQAATVVSQREWAYSLQAVG